MTRRFFALLLALSLLFGSLGLFSATASAETEVEFNYTLDDQGNAVIGMGGAYEAEHLVIPSEIDGHTVVGIRSFAFFEHTLLKSITLPETLVYIENNAFSTCYALESVIFEGTPRLETIERGAFEGCGSLKSFTIPASVTTIEDGAFYVCDGLESIIVEEGNKNFTVEGGALYNAEKTELIFALSGLSGTFTVPASVITIGAYSFSNRKGLENVIFEENSKLQVIDGSGFAYCTGLTSVTLPASLTTIGGMGFYGCTELKEVRFTGNGVTVGSRAFEKVDCTAYYPENNSTWTSEIMQDYGGTVAWTEYASASQTVKTGDVDGNGKIDTADMLALKYIILGIRLESTDSEKTAADIDGNGKVNTTDYMALRYHLLGVKPIEE